MFDKSDPASDTDMFLAGRDSFRFNVGITDDERRGAAPDRRPAEVKVRLAELLDELRSEGLAQEAERNIETFLVVADAFEADGLLMQAVDCLDDLAHKLEELLASRAGSGDPNSLIATDEDILPYRDCHNVHVIDDRYITGSEPTERGYRWLASKGVTTVISLRLDAEADAAAAHKVGLNHVHMPWPDEHAPSFEQVSQMLRVVESYPGRIFQHCLRGIGRDMTMSACYRIAHLGEQASDLIAEGQKQAPRWALDQVVDGESGLPVQFEFLRRLEQVQVS